MSKEKGVETVINNVGEKIKGAAAVICFLGIITAIMVGFSLMITKEDGIIFGIIVLLSGIFSSWVLFIILYGFGQLIENSQAIRDKTEAFAEENCSSQTFYKKRVTRNDQVNSYDAQITDDIVNKMVAKKIEELTKQFKDGKITKEEYQQQIQEL